MIFWCVVLTFLAQFLCAAVCNEKAPPNSEDKIECLYDKSPKCYVNSAVTTSNPACTSTADGGSPCKTIEEAKMWCKYNSEMYLSTSANYYEMTPPANVTGFRPGTYFEVLGDDRATTIVRIQTTDFDSVNAIGNDKAPVVLFLYKQYTRFSMKEITVLLAEPPVGSVNPNNYDFVNSKLIWIRDHATLEIKSVIFTGNGAFYPMHLFEYSGGYLTLINTQIKTNDYGQISEKPIKGSLIHWDAAGSTEAHVGTWTLSNVVFEEFSYSGDQSILWMQQSETCTLSITVDCVENVGCSSFKDIQYKPASSGSYSNANERGFVYTVSNHTKGDVIFRGTTFQKLNGGNNFAAPLVVKSVAANKQLLLDGVQFVENNGTKAGAIFTDISLNLTGAFKFENNKFLSGALNDILTETEGVVISTVGTGCIKGEVVIPGHDCSGRFTSCDGASRTLSCGEFLPEEDKPDTKISAGVIAVIIIVAVLVVAAIVVIIIVGVYFRQKKNRMQSLSEEDDIESSSSSLHERGDDLL